MNVMFVSLRLVASNDMVMADENMIYAQIFLPMSPMRNECVNSRRFRTILRRADLKT